MNNSNNHNHRTRSLQAKRLRASLTTLCALALFGLPATGSAMFSDAGLDETAAPIANTDSGCGQYVVGLDLDAGTGEVFLIEGTGASVLVDDELNVHFGTLNTVILDLEFSSGEWEVNITADGGVTQTYLTRGGAFRYPISTSVTEYMFEFEQINSGTAMNNMTMVPIPPVPIRPGTGCPPET